MRVRSMSLSVILSVIVTTAITIWAEFSVPLKDFLKSITGHHWVTKSILSIIIFFGVYLIARPSEKNINILNKTKKVIWVTLICILALLAFFTWHYFAA